MKKGSKKNSPDNSAKPQSMSKIKPEMGPRRDSKTKKEIQSQSDINLSNYSLKGTESFSSKESLDDAKKKLLTRKKKYKNRVLKTNSQPQCSASESDQTTTISQNLPEISKGRPNSYKQKEIYIHSSNGSLADDEASNI